MKITLNSIKITICILVAAFSITSVKAQTNTANAAIETLKLIDGTAFTAAKVAISWKVNADLNVVSFEIERSFDLNSFSTVATITDEFSSNDNTNTFRFNDASPALTANNMAYYRIKQINLDGSVSVSGIQVVSL